MISSELTRYERPSCECCRAMAPECMVPVDDAGKTLAMCWICAHLVTEHDHVVGDVVTHCTCASEDVYPPDVVELRRLRREVVDVKTRVQDLPFDYTDLDEDRSQTPSDYAVEPEFVGRHSKRWIDMKHGDGVGPITGNPYGISSTAVAIAEAQRAQLNALARSTAPVETMRTVAPVEMRARESGYRAPSNRGVAVARFVGEKPKRRA